MTPKIGQKIEIGIKSLVVEIKDGGKPFNNFSADLQRQGKKEIRTIKAIYDDGKVMDHCGEPWIVKPTDKQGIWRAVK